MAIEKKIKIENSADKIVKYWKDYFFKRHTKDVIINIIIILLALLIYFHSELIVLSGIIIVFCVLYLLFIFYFYYLAVLSNIKKRRAYYDNLSIVLSEESIEFIGSLSESKTKWEAFSEVIKGKDYYLLFDKTGRYVPIPNEVFITPDDKLWFENKLKQCSIKEK